MNFAKLLPIPAGETVTSYATKFIKELYVDLTSVLDEPHEIADRNERLASYGATLSTLIATYHQKTRTERDQYVKDKPKPEKGIREWEDGRDSITSKYRYTLEMLTQLREDLHKRISVAQTNLRVYQAEVGANAA